MQAETLKGDLKEETLSEKQTCLVWFVFVFLGSAGIKSMWPSTDNPTVVVCFALFGGECNYMHRSSWDVVCYIIASCTVTAVIPYTSF